MDTRTVLAGGRGTKWNFPALPAGARGAATVLVFDPFLTSPQKHKAEEVGYHPHVHPFRFVG